MSGAARTFKRKRNKGNHAGNQQALRALKYFQGLQALQRKTITRGSRNVRRGRLRNSPPVKSFSRTFNTKFVAPIVIRWIEMQQPLLRRQNNFTKNAALFHSVEISTQFIEEIVHPLKYPLAHQQLLLISVTLTQLMFWPFQYSVRGSYWLKVFALYALTEACIQLLFFFILNNFGTRPISNLQFHLVMWFFQSLMIWPIWWVAWLLRQYSLPVQIVVNIAFYAIYSYAWFGPLQDVINHVYNALQQLTVPQDKRLQAILDRGNQHSYLNYQLLKHAFRLSWFYMAAYFYNYRLEEKTRQELAVANKELQLKMLKWQLNPSFYFKTINNLLAVANVKPSDATTPILQLAKVMEYVIYETKEKLIAVNKEIQFINTYTQLINQQHENVVFEMAVSGNPDQLTIAPLLLAGFIDKIASSNTSIQKKKYSLQLHFTANELLLQINGSPQTGNFLYAARDESLNQRLRELYPSKHSISASNNNEHFKLNLLLDSEK